MDSEKFERNMRDVKRLYSYIVDNYNKLVDFYGFKDPISIDELFGFMAKLGYLSQNQRIDRNIDMYPDRQEISGVNIIRGHAVCRNYAFMLRDTYVDRGILSFPVMVTVAKPKIEFNNNRNHSMSIEQIYNVINNGLYDQNEKLNAMGIVMSNLGAINNVSIKYVVDDNKPNHAITAAFYNNNYYVVDSYNHENYKKKSKYSSTLEDVKNGYVVIRDYGSGEVSALLSNFSTTSFAEDKKTAAEAKKVFTADMNVFEKFYNENTRIYDEICDKSKILFNR